MKFIIYKDVLEEYRWRIKADNNRTIANSDEGYMYKSNAQEAIQIVKKYAPDALIIDETLSK